MNCKKCGNILNEGTNFCSICGEPITNPQINNSVGGSVLPNNNLNTPPIQPSVNPSQMPTNQNQMPQVNQPIQEPSVAQPIMPAPMAQPLQGPTTPIGAPIVEQATPVSPTTPVTPIAPAAAPTPVAGNQPNNMNQQTPPKNNKSFLIIVIVLVVAIIGVLVFIITNLSNQNSSSPKNNSETTEKKDDKENSNKDEEKDDNEDKEDNSSEEVSVENKKTYESNGYKFTIPNDIKSVIQDNILYISNGSDFQYNFEPFNMSYDSIVEDPSDLLSVFTEKGAIVGKSATKNYDGQEFFLVNLIVSGKPVVCYFSPIDNYNLAFGVGQATTISAHEKALNYISKIVASAETSSSFAPSQEEKFIPNFNTGREHITAVEFTLN